MTVESPDQILFSVEVKTVRLELRGPDTDRDHLLIESLLGLFIYDLGSQVVENRAFGIPELHISGIELHRKCKAFFLGFVFSDESSFSFLTMFADELFYKDALVDAESIVWDSLLDDRPPIDMLEYDWFAYPDDTYIVGHVFTQRLGCMDEKGRGQICKIKRRGGIKVIDIDCGMALNSKSSRLGCYQLDTGKEIYVTYK